MKSARWIQLVCFLPVFVLWPFLLVSDLYSGSYVLAALNAVTMCWLILVFPVFSTRKAKMRAALIFAVLLLALNFLFPVTSYPAKEQWPNGQIVVMQTENFVPVWTALAEHEKSPNHGNVFSDWIIRWNIVFLFAVGILVWYGLSILMIRTMSFTMKWAQDLEPSKPESESIAK